MTTPTIDPVVVWASAATLPLVQKTSDVLLSMVPNQDRRGRHTEASTAQKPAGKPAPKPGRTQRNAGEETRQKTYGAHERRELDRLIETTGGDGSQSQ